MAKEHKENYSSLQLIRPIHVFPWVQAVSGLNRDRLHCFLEYFFVHIVTRN